MELVEFFARGLLFFLMAFMFLMVLSLIRVGLQALNKWNEER